MKTKLTVTIDSELVPLAKKYANSQGVSLSSLIEQALRDMTKGQELEQQPSSPVEQDLSDLTKEQEPELSFVEKWRGKFGPMTDEEIDAARYEYLAQKYNL